MSRFFTEDVEQFFAKLVSACGISGNVEEVAVLLEGRLRSPLISIFPDTAGLGTFRADYQPSAPFRLMLASHMDAVGLRVNHIDDAGFCYVRAVGGIDLLSLKGQRVRIHTRDGVIPALVQAHPIHHQEEDQRKKVPALDHFYLRTPMTGKSNAKQTIRIGDPVTFQNGVEKLGDDLLTGPGLDNRLGVLLMAELTRMAASEKLKIGVSAVASCGEEIGCRGIRAVTQKIEPHLAIALDVTTVTDYPGANIHKLGKQRLGCGPVIARGYNTRTTFNELLMQTAESLGIAYQLRAEDITPTDGREIDEAGVPTIVVRVPATALHTSNDAVDRRDIESTAALLFAFMKKLSERIS